MKSLEICEALWRDNMGRQCMYALMAGVCGLCIFYYGVIQPQKERIEALLADIARLDQQLVQMPKPLVKVSSAHASGCAWEKQEGAWRMTGSFSRVYHCVLQAEDTRAVASMRLQKHIMGVSIMLDVTEMPT